MIFGAHVIVYSKDPAQSFGNGDQAQAKCGCRAFLKNVFGLASVDAGHGWLIFALPPAEVAVHPSEDDDRHELYFMSDDLRAEILALANKGVRCSEVQKARWGSITKIRLPGGSEIGFYQPKHPFALALTANWPPLGKE
jgi:hypothetical protein